MPRVPTADLNVTPDRALPGVRQSSSASPALLGAGAAQVGDLGRAVTDAGAKMQEREDADMLFRAETSIKDNYLKFESDVRNNRRGQQAWGVTQDADKWFADEERKHSEMLTNDRQRYLFNQSLTKLRQSAMGTLSGYEAGERRKSLEESAGASIVSSINLAATAGAEYHAKRQPAADGTIPDDGNDPIPGLKADMLKRVQAMSVLNGWTPERKTLEENKHLTNLHNQVLQGMVDRNPDAARRYFDANKAEINGADHDVIERTLRHGEAKQAGFAFAEREDIRQLNEADALTAARDFYKDDGDKRDAAVREIKTRFAEVTQNRERAQRDAADTAWGIFARSGFNAIPSSVISAMDGRDIESLRKASEDRASGRNVKTDFSTYYDLRQMAATDPETFRKTDLRRYVDRLSPSDLEEFAKLQTGKGAEAKDAATLTQQLSNTHNLMGWGSGDREKKGAFDKAATEAITAAQAGGKVLGYTERQQVIDRLLIEGDINGMWPGGKRKLYEVQGTPDTEKFEPEISDADRQTIVTRFEARAGRKPTDAEITQTFKNWKGL